MTRVNLVPTKELYDQHLMAEYREIPMVIGSLKRSLKSVSNNIDLLRSRIPSKYLLGKGHVSFFYDKGKWLNRRYKKCIDELEERNFKIDPDSRNVNWDLFKEYDLWNTNWKPSDNEINISRQRINFRINEKPNWYRRRTT